MAGSAKVPTHAPLFVMEEAAHLRNLRKLGTSLSAHTHPGATVYTPDDLRGGPVAVERPSDTRVKASDPFGDPDRKTHFFR